MRPHAVGFPVDLDGHERAGPFPPSVTRNAKSIRRMVEMHRRLEDHRAHADHPKRRD
jgi:hypothetical protein